MKALLIDHDDSFTHNLKHWLTPLFAEVTVVNHSQLHEITKFEKLEAQFDLFVLSPGPKNPQDYPQSLNLLKKLKPITPVYGVCLGLQMMAVACGVSISTYTPPLHGKTSKLDSKDKFFQDLKVARYHSIKVDSGYTTQFEKLAESTDDQNPMWLKHKIKKWMGVQFHPESFLTEKAELHLNAISQWMKS